MKKLFTLLPLLPLILFFSGCQKESPEPVSKKERFQPAELKEGFYTGVFYRTDKSGNKTEANITLTVTSQQFSGTTDMDNYPAIGEGTYSISGSEIHFIDHSFWTANFDWTLILKGTFSIAETDNEIILTKVVNDVSTDVYRLKKV